jgi:hypothetical protein
MSLQIGRTETWSSHTRDWFSDVCYYLTIIGSSELIVYPYSAHITVSKYIHFFTVLSVFDTYSLAFILLHSVALALLRPASLTGIPYA